MLGGEVRPLEYINSLMMLAWSTRTLLVLGLLWVMGSPAHGHVPPSLRACPQFATVPFQASSPTILQTRLLPNGLWAELYDANMDGAPDFATYSVTKTLELGDLEHEHESYPHMEFPILYEIDTDGDAIPNDVLIDVYGKGLCADLLPYTTMAHESIASKVYWLLD